MRTILQSVALLAALTLVLGFAYPAAITAVAALLFPHEARGSIAERAGRPVGSVLLGQPFSDARYFWGRPSATGPMPYNAASSSGSNLGPTNPALVAVVKERVAALRAAHPGESGPVPADLVTASASGLDPHISLAAARFQIARVAAARRLEPGRVEALVAAHTEGRQFGFLGEPRVNVLQLNLALDSPPS